MVRRQRWSSRIHAHRWGGSYAFTVPAGSYYVRAGAGGYYINELYYGVNCADCSVASSGGMLIPVTAAGVVTGIDFDLEIGGRISGTVTNRPGARRSRTCRRRSTT